MKTSLCHFLRLLTRSAIVSSLVILGINSARAITPLYIQNFDTSPATPTDWVYGTASLAGTLNAEDSIVVNTTSGKLVVTDVPPLCTSSAFNFHSTPAINFRDTGDKILQCNVEASASNGIIMLGLFDSTTSAYSINCNAVYIKFNTAATTNNVILYTTDRGGSMTTLTTATTLQSNINGSHNYAIQIDFSTSTTTPTVRAYSNGILMATGTYSSGWGIHPQSTGYSQGTGIRVRAQFYSGTPSTTLTLDNIAVNSYTPGTNLLTQIKGTRGVNRNIFGQNVLGGESKYYYSMYANGFWDPNAMTYSSTLVNKTLNDLGPISSLRYPGGGMACLFDFKKTIGPTASRSDAVDGTTVVGKWAFGLDEYMSLCKALGSEPMYTAPELLLPVDQMPEHLANLIEYLNAPASDANPWALKRLANTGTCSSGYGVRYFELGNEPFFARDANNLPMMTVETYCSYVKQVAWAMRAVDPNIQLGIPAYQSGSLLRNYWDQPMLQQVGGIADFVIFHIYTPNAEANDTYFSDPQKMVRGALAVGAQIDQNMKSSHAVITELVGHDLPVAITEFNCYFKGNAPKNRLSYAVGMQMTEMIQAYMKPENGVLTANYWQMFGSYFGPLNYNVYATATASTPFTEYPPYPIFKLWGQHYFKGSSLQDVTVSGPTSDYAGYQKTLPASGDVYEPQEYVGTVTLSSYYPSYISGMNTNLASGCAGTATATYAGDQLTFQFNGYDAYHLNSSGVGLTGLWPTLARITYTEADRYDFYFSCEAAYQDGVPALTKPMWLTGLNTGDPLNNVTTGNITNSSFKKFVGWYSTTVTSTQSYVCLNVISPTTATNSVTFSGTLQIRNAMMDVYKQERFPSYPVITSAASLSTDGNTCYMMVTNKSNYATPMTLSFSSFAATTAKYWQVNANRLTSCDLGTGKLVASNQAFPLDSPTSTTYVFPPHSVTAIELTR